MKLKHLTILLILWMFVQLLLSASTPEFTFAETAPSVFVGVDVAYDNITATKQLADKIRTYANLIIIGCAYDINFRNKTRLNELFDLCQYLYDKGFYLMLFENIQPIQEIVDHVRLYGDRFLGFFAYDEMGGRQLDQASNNPYFNESESYGAASTFFVNRLHGWLFDNSTMSFCRNFNHPTEFRLFTSDYALYWFDYKAGYDVVLAQLGWNYSRQLNIALCRGAASVQGKEWGTMILWKYTQPPYMESSSELYNDMVLSYNNGAKFITIFDSDANYTESVLTQEHLEAMKLFWQYIQDNPRVNVDQNGRFAYALPEGYAYGFRGPKDKIWGIWDADMTSFMISISVNIMLERYGPKLDIIYEEALSSGKTFDYNDIILWNDPTAVSDLWPSDWPIPTITPIPVTTTSATILETPKGFENPNKYVYIVIGWIAVVVTVAVGLVLRWKLRRSRIIHY